MRVFKMRVYLVMAALTCSTLIALALCSRRVYVEYWLLRAGEGIGKSNVTPALELQALGSKMPYSSELAWPPRRAGTAPTIEGVWGYGERYRLVILYGDKGWTEYVLFVKTGWRWRVKATWEKP